MTLSFLYAGSAQVRNRTFHVNEKLFLNKFVNVRTECILQRNSNIIII